MSYLRKIKYKVVPEESYQVIRNCSGCGCKSNYLNTHNFRVNANGNRIDVWLIYQCEKCKHTFNLSIYERMNPDRITQEEYEMFLENNKELAECYGVNKSFFTKNRATVDMHNINYEVVPEDSMQPTPQAGDLFVIYNPTDLKVRIEKVIADIFQITRSKVKKLEEDGKISIEQNKLEHTIAIEVKQDLAS